MEQRKGREDRWERSPQLCRTVVGDGDRPQAFLAKRKFGQGYGGNHGRIIVTSSGARRVRREGRTVGFRFLEEGKETIVYAGRTTVTDEERGENKKRRGLESRVANCKGFGRIRTHFVVKESINGKRDSNGSDDEVIELIDVSTEATVGNGNDGGNDGNNALPNSRRNEDVGERSRRRRKRRRRNEREVDEDNLRGRKRRRMCEITLDQFRMFGEDGEDLQSRNNDSTATAGVLTHVDKFKKSIRAIRACFLTLQQTWRDVPFVRCSGGSRRDQKFICAATTRLRRKLFDGGFIVSVIICFLLEEESNKLRTLNVRSETEVDDRGNALRNGNAERNMNWICACDIRRTGSGMEDSRCWHIMCLKEDEMMVDEVNKIMECGFKQDHNLYFGEELAVRETGLNRLYVIDGMQLANGIVAVQLDTVTKEDLLRKGRSVTKKRSNWITIDPADRMIVGVVWKAMSSGAFATRMACGMCRMDTAKKCCHEVACEIESANVVNDSDSSECYEEDMAGGEQDGGVPDVEPVQSPTVHGNEHSTEHEAESRNGNVSDAGEDPNEDGRRDPNGRPGGSQPATQSWKAINESKCYFPTGPNRSFMFCASERRKAELLTDLLETTDESAGSLMFHDPDGVRCAGIVRGGNSINVKCKAVRKKSIYDTTRRCTLVTLNHGTVGIVVMDWKCSVCSFLNRYRGYSHGIFPAARGLAFTVELMYYWISEACNSTRSFRSVYSSTTKLKCSPSYNRRYDMERMSKLDGWHKGNRRTANDAMRRYIGLIDLDRQDIAGQIFTCRKCEVEMDDKDFQQLSLKPEDHKGTKRLHSVVIDAKVIGLLKESGVNSDKHDVLTGVTGLAVRIINNRPTQNALRFFIRLVRNCISKCRNRRASGQVTMSEIGTENEVMTCKRDGYFIEDNYLFVRLAHMEKFIPKKGGKEKTKLKDYIGTIKWFLDNCACLCVNRAQCTLDNRGTQRVEDRNSAVRCKELRSRLQNANGRGEATYALQNFFVHCFVEDDVEDNASGANATTDPNSHSVSRHSVSRHDNEDEATTRDVEHMDGESSCSDDNAETEEVNQAVWARLVFGDFFNIEYQLETVLEVILFTLTEPISLGFFPYTGATSDNTTDTAASSHAGVTEAMDGNIGNVNGSRPAPNVGLHPGSNASDIEIRDVVKILATESVSLHQEAIAKLEEAADCTHHGRRTDQWVCSICANSLSKLNPRLSVQNSVLGNFVDEAVRYGESSPVFTRRAARVVAFLFKRRVNCFEQYLSNLAAKLHPSSIQYWRTFGAIGTALSTEVIDNTSNCSGDNSLYVFPGRIRCRNGIAFDKIDKQECTKHYFKRGNTVVPSLLTVQCACAHPKLMGFVLLNKCESISAALSSVVTHFSIPPRVIWYDNACNTYDSGLLRIPWLLRWSRLVVDRFHYKGHNCSNVFNGDKQQDLDDDRSVAAEVINSIINKGASHIAYLDGDNVKPFMKVVFAYVNATAAIRDMTGRDDLEDDDVEKLIADRFTCYCEACVQRAETGETTTMLEGVSLFTRSNEVVDITRAN